MTQHERRTGWLIASIISAIAGLAALLGGSGSCVDTIGPGSSCSSGLLGSTLQPAAVSIILLVAAVVFLIAWWRSRLVK